VRQAKRPTTAAAVWLLGCLAVAPAAAKAQARRPGEAAFAQAAPADRAWIEVLPIAGVPGEDFYVGKLFDRDPAPGAACDFMGGERTYDGHQGTDLGLAGFEVMEIGVPVLAVLEGTVTAVIDGQDDHQTTSLRGRLGNGVAIRHDSSRSSYYGHLRKGSMRVRPGERVQTGQQIAEVGSSGDSSGPHLHFECIENRRRIDPFAPPSHAAESRWVHQPSYTYPVKAIDAGISLERITEAFQMPRTPFVREGAGRIDFWILTINQEDNDVRLWELIRPDGGRQTTWVENIGQARELYHSWWWVEAPQWTRGHWTVRVYSDRKPVASIPLVVLATSEPAPANRPPSRPQATLFPRSPAAGEPVICRVAFAGLAADPDLDRVAYHYVWSSDGRALRDATTAVRADYLPAGAAESGSLLRCEVSATDGRLSSSPANLSVRVK